MWQRARYGYAECDWWALDHHLLSFLPEAIRKYKFSLGYPAEFVDEENGVDRWHQVLEEIASGLEAGLDWVDMEGYDEFYDGTAEEIEEKRKKRFPGVSTGHGTRRLLSNSEVGLVFHQDDWDQLQSDRKRKFDHALDLLKIYFFSLWD